MHKRTLLMYKHICLPTNAGVLQKFMVVSCPEDFKVVIMPDESEIFVKWADGEQSVKLLTGNQDRSNNIQTNIERYNDVIDSDGERCMFTVTLRGKVRNKLKQSKTNL